MVTIPLYMAEQILMKLSLQARLSIFILLFLSPLSSEAASLLLSPASASVQTGQTVSLSVRVVSTDQSVNAVSGTVTVPPGLTISSVSKSNSIVNFWVIEPSVSGSAVNFEGVVLNPGYQGPGGTVLTLNLRAASAGVSKVSFQSGQILANDGAGTDVTQGLNSASITVTQPAPQEPKPTPPPEPEIDEEPIEEEPEPKPIVQIPRIAYDESGKTPVFLGTTSYPNAAIVISFIGTYGKLYVSDITDSSGAFRTPSPKALRSGVYQVTVAVVLPDGEASEPSEPITVSLGGLFSLDVDVPLIIFFSLFGVGVISLVLSLIWKVTHTGGIRGTVSRIILGEVKEADTVVHKSFKLLRSDVRSHLKDVDSQKPAERAESLAELEKNLEEAEEIIRKEIDDINDAVHGDKK